MMDFSQDNQGAMMMGGAGANAPQPIIDVTMEISSKRSLKAQRRFLSSCNFGHHGAALAKRLALFWNKRWPKMARCAWCV